MVSFFIGFAFFELGALCGFFVAALMQAARIGEITIEIKEDDCGAEHSFGSGNQTGAVPETNRD